MNPDETRYQKQSESEKSADLELALSSEDKAVMEALEEASEKTE